MSLPGLVPFLLSPRTEYEARYGKGVLLTDCELGILISALTESNIRQDDEDAAVTLYIKLFAALDGEPPYGSIEEG